MELRRKTISFGSADVGFKNFTGEKKQYNDEGDKNFVIFIHDPAEAEGYSNEGLRIKMYTPKDDTYPPVPYLPVKIGRGCTIYYMDSNNNVLTTMVGEDDISNLDWADIENFDVVVSLSPWEMNGNTGVKAYAKNIYIQLATDEFQEKYGINAASNQSSF